MYGLRNSDSLSVKLHQRHGAIHSLLDQQIWGLTRAAK
jgi:hypothetical protein